MALPWLHISGYNYDCIALPWLPQVASCWSPVEQSNRLIPGSSCLMCLMFVQAVSSRRSSYTSECMWTENVSHEDRNNRSRASPAQFIALGLVQEARQLDLWHARSLHVHTRHFVSPSALVSLGTQPKLYRRFMRALWQYYFIITIYRSRLALHLMQPFHNDCPANAC